MKLKEFLERNPTINTAQLARKMWPDNKSAPSKLTNKLNENIAGDSKQRITEKDLENAKAVLKELADDIYKTFK
ncbi:hypothetical protein [Chryseobacterium rhizosphaerae]|uniref:Transcriptional regulator n=1 Tax=Chryseobacterium rhizosphaerae TaxID=395937 RepID=A0ABX9IJ06_9FLAO|nr:hypothetical protein [Chryseobacterium rhizosphaerae]REC74672.1 hypothetical protein DRF57_13025 [Chryseobacterium rhizosphaerae]GEN66286.1 hypothetical protein CRH01_08540 [Chryseobacterium rhizosphaerae]